MGCTSRASRPRSTARRSAPAPRRACMKASRGCGRTWSAAAAASGSISIRYCARRFPEQLGKVPLETFYRAINKVERSLIRTEADEVTYNLHIILRFDLEIDLLERRLAVKDLPRGLAGALPVRSRRRARPTTGTAACRTCIGIGGLHRRRLPQLHHRQRAERAVLCGRAARPSGDSRGDRRGPRSVR